MALKQDDNFMNNIRDFIVDGRIEAALSFCKSANRPIARMMEKGIKRIGRPLKEIEESIEIVGKFEVYKLEKNIIILAIVAGIAPMFGFIGTIIGVIKIFHDISLAGDVEHFNGFCRFIYQNGFQCCRIAGGDCCVCCLSLAKYYG